MHFHYIINDLIPTHNKKSFNVVYQDGIIPIEYTFNNQVHQKGPNQIFENDGFPIKLPINFSIQSGHQKIIKLGISFNIPPKLYGVIKNSPYAIRHEPHVAPGLIINQLKPIHILVANLYQNNLEIKWGQTLAYLYFEPIDELATILEFGSLSEFGIDEELSSVNLIS